MKIKTLEDLLTEQIRTLHNAETQITDFFPKIIRKIKDQKLKMGYSEHLATSRKHLILLEELSNLLEINPKGKKCLAMAGLLDEMKQLTETAKAAEVREAILNSYGKKIDHYRTDSFESIISLAHTMNNQKLRDILAFHNKSDIDSRQNEIPLEEMYQNSMQRKNFPRIICCFICCWNS